jgi:hypothetical protein
MQVFHSMHRALATAAAISLALGLGSCGGGGPMTPSPSPSATPPQPGGPVTGGYLLQITPGPGCNMPRNPLTFIVQAAAAGTQPHPGVQVLLAGGATPLEMELLSTGTALRGGVATLNDDGLGALSSENMQVWVHAIASGNVFGAPDGRGQIVSGGTLAGSLAISFPNGAVGALGSCTATDHGFVLRAQ